MWFRHANIAAVGVFSLAVAAPAASETLQQSLGDLDVHQRWEYNDWQSAKAASIQSKKPIFALFR